MDRERYSCLPTRRAAIDRSDRSYTDGVARSSATVASGVGCDRRTSTRVVAACPAFRIHVLLHLFVRNTQRPQVDDRVLNTLLR